MLGENYEDTFDITVKAEDFKFGIERTLSEQTGSADAPLFSAVKSISTPDDFTIVFNLSYADDNFLYALTNPGAMPCDEEFSISQTVSTGLTRNIFVQRTVSRVKMDGKDLSKAG